MYLLSREKTGQTKEELSACDGASIEKKEGKRCRDAVFYSPTEKKNILLCLIIFQLESWPQSTEMHEKTALSGIKCQWNC